MPAPFEPTEAQRRLVRAMAGFGVPQEGIATLLEIDPKTLRRHFRAELDRGAVEATAKVAQSLFQMATQGRNVAAAIFWMKARAGWRERHEVAVSTAAMSPRDMTDEQLLEIIAAGRQERALDTEAEEDGPDQA